MAFVTNNPGNIMTSRAAKALLEGIHGRLGTRMAEMESRDYLALLHRFREELLAEENIDAWIADEFAALRGRLAEVRLVDELCPLYERLRELTIRHFRARTSVSTLHDYGSQSLETLLSTALSIAATMLHTDLHGEKNGWALFASDGLGRRETTRKGHNAIIFIHDDEEGNHHEHYHLLALQLMAILNECGIAPHFGLQRNGHIFWHGSINEWRQQLLEATGGASAGPAASEPLETEQYAHALEILTDLRLLCGDRGVASRVTEMADAILSWERSREPFRQYALRVATMPVALGIFGRFRTAMTGKHRGEFSLEEMAIRPLVASVRILAVAAGIHETSTAERIKALLVNGTLGVALADRLLVALHDFTRCQIELELGEATDGDEYFFNPDVLSGEARERFKAGLEDLTTLQRHVYQQYVEVG
jgi:signal-transduction protein with cAMP-binding, CBS, and nucleotidyltransferase domain